MQEYLAVPDVRSTGRGMVAGGSLSPLLGAIYLSPLDTAIEDLREHCDIDYIRYADDFIIMARTQSYFDGQSCACTKSSPTFAYRFIPTKDSLDGQKGGVIFWDLFCTRTGTLSPRR